MDNIKLILKYLRVVSKKIENYELSIDNLNVTKHDKNAVVALKKSYELIYSIAEKLFSKGATPPNNIGGHLNGSQVHQEHNNNNNNYSYYYTTINNYYLNQTTRKPASGPSHIMSVSPDQQP